MNHGIWTAALITAMCVAAPRTQDRPQSMTTKLLERLDRLAERLDDEELSADLRAEMQDLMEMLKAQLSKGDYADALEGYRKAATDALRGIDLGQITGQLKGLGELKDLEGLKLLQEGKTLNLDKLGDQLKGLSGLKSLEGLKLLQEGKTLNLDKLGDQLKGLSGLKSLEGLKVLQEGNVQNLARARQRLGEAGESVKRSAAAIDYTDLLGRLQDRGSSLESTLERVSEILQETLETVPEETVEKILESVRRVLRETSSGSDTARNLYRSLTQDPPRATGRSQDAQEEWRSYVEEATKEWQKYADQARQEWEKAMKESRARLDDQMKRAMDSYRKALEKRKDSGGDDNPLVWTDENGKVFSVTAPENWYSTEGGNVFFSAPKAGEGGNGFWLRTEEGEPRVYYNVSPAEKGGSVYWMAPGTGQPQVFDFKPSAEGGNVLWTSPDGEKSGVFKFEGSGNFFFKSGEEGEDRPVFRSFGEGEGAGSFYRTLPKDEDSEKAKPGTKVKADVKVGVTDEVSTGTSFLESFRQDMSRRSAKDVVELQDVEESEVTEEQEIEEIEEVEEAEAVEEIEIEEPEAVELIEPALLETRESRSNPDDVNVQIRNMVDDLRKEMQEIRELVKALREKARNQPR